MPLYGDFNSYAQKPMAAIKWVTGDLARLDETPMSIDTIDEWTKSLVDDTAGGGVAPRVRFAGNGTGNEGETSRIWYPMNETLAVDSEVLGVWAKRQGGAFGQFGNLHRVTGVTGGEVMGYIVWQDVTVGFDHLLNFGVWRRTAAGAFDSDYTTDNIGKTFAGAPYRIAVEASYRLSNTVTLLVNDTHRIEVNDVITVTGTDFDANTTVTAVTDTTVSYALTGVDSLNGGSGNLLDYTRIQPYYVRSRLEGTRLWAKIWRSDQGEPSWGDSRHSAYWDNGSGLGPTTAGRNGIMAAHLGPTHTMEYGPVTIWNLDGE